MITIKNLNKKFGDNEVIKNLNLEVNKSQKIVIMGPSGCGKSTLLRILATLEDFQEGDITIDGDPLKTIKPISRKISMVFQSFNLFEHMNTLKNLTFAPLKIHGADKAIVANKANELLDLFSLTNQRNQYPSTLSGGQKQRVAIARSLMMDPPVLLFDEPTSSLDPEMTSEVLKSLLHLSKLDKTILCVTHEVEFARSFADKIAFFHSGELIAFEEVDLFFQNDHPAIAQFLQTL